MNSIFWHDYETTGTSPALDRPIQFAGIRTDEDLNVIGDPVSLYCQPSKDVLPHPEACLVTGISPQLAEAKGLPEPDFIAAIHRQFMVPGTCGAGYNSIRFDDEVTRYTLYRNFYDPYEREWQGGNSRWDIIDMLRLAHALRPEGINWPKNDDGYTSFRLELLTKANGIGHESAHDALSDVEATIAMARLMKEKQPKLYSYAFEHRHKRQVAELLDLGQGKPFLHVSSRLPREKAYTALMIPLCMHPVNKNAVVAFNLSCDPRPLMELSADEIRARVFTAAADLQEGIERIPLKAVHINRCPMVATAKLLDSNAADRLGIDIPTCEKHWRLLKNTDLSGKLTSVFSELAAATDRDVESALYEGFLNPADKGLLNKIRHAQPAELGVLQSRFQDKRYRELLFRYRARYYPQSLNAEEALVWDEQRYRMLTEPSPGRLTLDEYFARIDELEKADLSDRDISLLASLREWGDRLLCE